MLKAKQHTHRGKVFLVGAGPGDPDLITLKAMRCLQKANVVLYDRLINPQLLSYAVRAKLIYTGKRAGGDSTRQRDIEQLLIDHALDGKIVVRLKGGDPFIFGRGGEEAQALKRAGVPYEIVPGITSAIAAPAYAGIPLTHRGCASSAAIVTGHDVGKVNWRLLLSAVDTIVILMGLKNLPQIMSRLIEGGCDRNKPVALIQSGTNISQKKLDGTVSTIASFAQRWQFHGATVIVVGEVVRLGKDLEWFNRQTAANRCRSGVRRNGLQQATAAIDHQFI
jgi:uroporphyrin-III C-methyltransferase